MFVEGEPMIGTMHTWNIKGLSYFPLPIALTKGILQFTVEDSLGMGQISIALGFLDM